MCMNQGKGMRTAGVDLSTTGRLLPQWEADFFQGT